MFGIVLCGGMGTACMGCARPWSSPIVRADAPTVMPAMGDWDDVQAAMLVAAPAGEMGIEQVVRGEGVVTYRLRTITDQDAVVTIERAGEPNRHGTLPLTLSARVLPDGDAEREAKVLRALHVRLGQLAGVRVAPRDAGAGPGTR